MVCARASIDRDQHERRPQRDGRKGVRRHPVHLLAGARRQNGDARREHPERPPERRSGIALESLAELELLDVRERVERVTERVGDTEADGELLR